MPSLNKPFMKKYARKSTSKRASTKRGRYSSSMSRVARISGTAVPRIVGSFKGTFPQHLTTTHKFTTTFNLTFSAGNSFFNSYNISANGMNDCDITSVGTKQPLYYVTLSAIYDHYVVSKSKIKYTAYSTTAGVASVVAVVFLNDDTTTTPTNVYLAADQTLASPLKPIIPSIQPSTYYCSYDAYKQYGPGWQGQDRLIGASGATTNPPETSVFTFVAEANLAANSNILVQAEVEYTAVWSELKDRIV